jgi:hypothetical protein
LCTFIAAFNVLVLDISEELVSIGCNGIV